MYIMLTIKLQEYSAYNFDNVGIVEINISLKISILLLWVAFFMANWR